MLKTTQQTHSHARQKATRADEQQKARGVTSVCFTGGAQITRRRPGRRDRLTGEQDGPISIRGHLPEVMTREMKCCPVCRPLL